MSADALRDRREQLRSTITTRPQAPAAAYARARAAGRRAPGARDVARRRRAVAAAIGLIATSAWLISRSAQRPQESAVAIAIVGVQFFALDPRRCAATQSGSSATTRLSACSSQIRVGVYERLERLAPLGLPAFRSGDLLARLVHDVDALQDLLLRVLPPFAIALGVGAATVALVWCDAAGGRPDPARGARARRHAGAVADRAGSPRAARLARRRRARS